MSEKLMEQDRVLSFGYSEAVNELLKISKQRKEDLDHQILLAENHLKQLQEKNIKDRQLHDQWKREDSQKHQDQWDLKFNEQIRRENELNVLSQQIERRSHDLKQMELKAKEILELKSKLDDDRIEVERIRVRANESMLEANKKMAQILGDINAISFREEKAKKLEEELKQKNIDLAHREDKLKAESLKLEKEYYNIEELRKVVEPKVKDIDIQLSTIEQLKKEIDAKESEIKRKIDEDKAMMRAIEDRDAKVTKRERDMLLREEELKRQSILIKSVK